MVNINLLLIHQQIGFLVKEIGKVLSLPLSGRTERVSHPQSHHPKVVAVQKMSLSRLYIVPVFRLLLFISFDESDVCGDVSASCQVFIR